MNKTVETTKPRTEVRGDAEHFHNSQDETRTQSTGPVADLARTASVDVGEYPDNNRGNAYMFRDFWQDDIRPVVGTPDGWLRWDGNVWVSCKTPDLYDPFECAVEIPFGAEAERLRALADTEDDDTANATRKRAADYARRSSEAGNVRIMDSTLHVMRTVQDVSPVHPEALDVGKLTLGVGNGVLVVDRKKRTVTLRDARKADMVTMNTGVEYDPDAAHPLWDGYLDTFLPDLEYRRFVRKVFGYGLLGGNPGSLMVFLLGPTSTGKSTMISACSVALGKYAGTVNVNAIFREKADAGPAPEMIDALPKRMVFSSEVGSHNRLHADVIKRLTGGDNISGRGLFSNYIVTRKPMFTPYIATNSMPTITNGDAALSRRMLVLPFDRQVEPGDEVHAPVEQTDEGRRAVLAWLVEGLRDYLREGLSTDTWPDVVKRAKDEAIRGTSDLAGWFFERYEVTGDDKHSVPIDALLLDLQRWELANGTKDRERTARAGLKKWVEGHGATTVRRNESAPEARLRTGTKRGDVKRTKVDMFVGVRAL